ncbi:hypothetical protein PC9H_010370 [Pleurotus ostreatus]|uniref:Uncharacterized protein n=1 Tax=Pleurotus ostreatus TaxID=5322 RepID=A0A8H6ZMN5_PLEOS|nr:uncharacterized protein PC9H_010370 [Pleurotus ostreatus]KAF7422214.1 hypothetical protein PC9H_010370 [Pleurotus ostreatus]KAJ8691996.1 hypothetical protein PTI98_011512 [Pleurotus ostreatus]
MSAPAQTTLQHSTVPTPSELPTSYFYTTTWINIDDPNPKANPKAKAPPAICIDPPPRRRCSGPLPGSPRTRAYDIDIDIHAHGKSDEYGTARQACRGTAPTLAKVGVVLRRAADAICVRHDTTRHDTISRSSAVVQ